MNNLEPRAKIGDVILKRLSKSEMKDSHYKDYEFVYIQLIITSARFVKLADQDEPEYWVYEVGDDEDPIFNEDIIKNLTTNISYDS